MRILRILPGSHRALMLSVGVGLLLLDCGIKNPTEELNLILDIGVEKPIYSGSISAEPTVIPLVPDSTTIPGIRGAVLAKTTVSDFIEVPVTIPNMSTFLSILEDETAEGGNFVGTLTNRATNPVTFGLYFSATAGLADPWNAPEALFIASLTLPAAPSTTEPAAPVHIDGPEDFDVPSDPDEVKTSLKNFIGGSVATVPAAPVIVYLTSRTPEINPAEEIDVLIEDMSLYLPAEVEVWNTITPGDLDNYANKIEEILTARMNGTITNNGSVGLRFYAYLYLASEEFNSLDHIIAKVTIVPGSTLIFADYPDMLIPGDPAAMPPRLSGEQKLRNGISHLQSGHNLTAYLHFYSLDATTPISATVDGIELQSNVRVIEEY